MANDRPTYYEFLIDFVVLVWCILILAKQVVLIHLVLFGLSVTECLVLLDIAFLVVCSLLSVVLELFCMVNSMCRLCLYRLI